MRDYRRLLVWQKAHQLALGIYRATEAFPSSERYGLTSQLRRSAVSVPSNLAEGSGRHTDRDFSRFVSIAAGSANEVEYQLLLALDLGYLRGTDHARLTDQTTEIRRMLTALGRKLRRDG